MRDTHGYTHSQALRIRRECANCIAMCAVRMYACPGVRAPRCVYFCVCVCVRFNNHCNCCWLAFFIICKPMYPAFYCQAAARPRPLQAQLQLNPPFVYPVHLHTPTNACCALKYVNKFRIRNARADEFASVFCVSFLTGNARKLHCILGSTCVCVCV